MSLLDFKKRFGQDINIEEVKKNFVHEINYFLIEPLDKKIGNYYFDENPLFDKICLDLTLSPSSIISKWNERDYSGTDNIPSLRKLTGDDFEKTLVIIESVYEYFLNSSDYDKDDWLKRIDISVKQFLNQILSLKMYWYEGKFYPEGAKELDEKLINENLNWLKNYPKVKILFSNALDHYSQSMKTPIKRKDVISNSFQAVEEMTRIFLGNDKPFDSNFNALVKNLGLIKQWGNILNFYKEISKEFGRHPGRTEEYMPRKEDTEAFLYLSGILLRLVSIKLIEKT